MQDPRFWTVGETVGRAMSSFRTRRGEKTIWAGVRRVKVRTPAQKVIYLPNGHHVNVSVDDSGVATQVEDAQSLHGIARPHATIRKVRMTPQLAQFIATARPRVARAAIKSRM